VVSRQNADIVDTLQLDIATATTFWLSMGYNLGYNFVCMTASNSVFDSMSGFFRSNSDEDIAEINCPKHIAMATNFGT